jgi:hypothetical protein
MDLRQSVFDSGFSDEDGTQPTDSRAAAPSGAGHAPRHADSFPEQPRAKAGTVFRFSKKMMHKQKAKRVIRWFANANLLSRPTAEKQ